MKVSDVYPPRGSHYERLDQMDHFRMLYSKLIRDYLYRWSNQAYDAYEILYVIPDSNYTR